MPDAVILQHPPHGDGAWNRKTGIRIHQLVDPVAQRAGHDGDDLFRAPRPLVDVFAALCPDAPLGCREALLCTKARQAFRLVFWGNVALHRTGIGADPPRRTAQKAGHRLACAPAGHVPQRRIQPCKRPRAVTAWIFVLAAFNQVDKSADIRRISAQSPGRDLAVEHLRGDVGIVG